MAACCQGKSSTTSHISPVSSFLPSLLSYCRFLALAVSLPTAGVAMVFFKDLSSGSSSGDDSFTTQVCLSSLSRAMTWNEGFLPGGRFESFLPLCSSLRPSVATNGAGWLKIYLLVVTINLHS